MDGHLCYSEMHDPFPYGTSCTCSLGSDVASSLFLFSMFVTMLGSCLVVFLVPSLWFGVKYVLPLKNWSWDLRLIYYFCLYPQAPPFHCGPHFFIWYSHQFGNVSLAFWIVLSFPKTFMGQTNFPNLCETAFLKTSFYTSIVN